MSFTDNGEARFVMGEALVRPSQQAAMAVSVMRASIVTRKIVYYVLGLIYDFSCVEWDCLRSVTKLLGLSLGLYTSFSSLRVGPLVVDPKDGTACVDQTRWDDRLITLGRPA